MIAVSQANSRQYLHVLRRGVICRIYRHPNYLSVEIKNMNGMKKQADIMFACLISV